MKKIIKFITVVFIALAASVTPVFAQETSVPEEPVVARVSSRNVSKSTTQTIKYIGLSYKITTTVSGTINYNSSGAATSYSLGVSGSWVNKPSSATIKYTDISYGFSGANVLAHFRVGIIVGGTTTWGLLKTLTL